MKYVWLKFPASVSYVLLESTNKIARVLKKLIDDGFVKREKLFVLLLITWKLCFDFFLRPKFFLQCRSILSL